MKDRYKEAKEKNKKSGEARNTPKYYDIFDEVLGTRSVVQLGEVREAGGSAVADAILTPTEDVDDEANAPVEDAGRKDTQPKRQKKKKASKASATNNLVECLTKMQEQQQETMAKFLDGMKQIEENSRKHTSDVLLKVAELFANKKRKKNQEESDESD